MLSSQNGTSVRLIEESFGRDRPTIGVVAQRVAETEDPTYEQVHELGTVARVLKVIRLSSGNYSVEAAAYPAILGPLKTTEVSSATLADLRVSLDDGISHYQPGQSITWTGRDGRQHRLTVQRVEPPASSPAAAGPELVQP